MPAAGLRRRIAAVPDPKGGQAIEAGETHRQAAVGEGDGGDQTFDDRHFIGLEIRKLIFKDRVSANKAFSGDERTTTEHAPPESKRPLTTLRLRRPNHKGHWLRPHRERDVQDVLILPTLRNAI
jgi:hypothetical protein